MNPEIIRALTPLILGGTGAIAGGVIALAAILSPSLQSDRFWAAITFATSAIGTFGGAAGGAAIPGNNRGVVTYNQGDTNIDEDLIK